MAWYDPAWQFRKKLTVPAANVAGSSVLSGVPTLFLPSADADVLASARVDGKDILFTSADGSTKLPHELSPDKQFLTRDGTWSWFGMPSAVYHNGTNERLYVGVATRFPSGSSRQMIVQYDYATGAITETHIGTVDASDDHNNPTILVRSLDSKLIVFYPKHHSNDVMAMRVSTNAEDATAWGAETELDPNTAVYGYPSPVELTDEGNIYLFYRKDTGNQYFYIVSADDGATWGSAVSMFTSTGFGDNPYRTLCSNDFDRIDFLVSSGTPNLVEDHFKVGHFYYDGTWRNSTGTDIGAPPFDWADLTTIFDGTAADERAWIGDITYDSANRPHVLFIIYPDDLDDGNQELWEGEFDGSTWTTRLVTSETTTTGAGPVANRPVYHAASKLDPADDTIAWVGKRVGSIYEIQKWKKTAGTWAKAAGADGDVTTGSHINHFRPLIAKNCPAGKKGRLLFLSPYDYTDITNYVSAVATFPALGSHFARAYIRADLDGANDTDLYVYYGNPTVTADQQDAAGTWADYLRVHHTEERYGASAGWLEDASGNGAPENSIMAQSAYRATGYAGPANVGNAISFASQRVDIGTPNLASFTGLCVEAWARSTLSSTQAIISTGFSTSNADIALWLDSTPGLQVHCVVLDNSYKFAAPLSGITPTADTWTWFGLLWSAAGGLQGRMNQTETTVASSTAVSLDDGATGTVSLGQTPAGANALAGGVAEIRITDNVYRSKDFTDTQYDNWVDGNTFFTIGAEETPPSTSGSFGVMSGGGYGVGIKSSGRM